MSEDISKKTILVFLVLTILVSLLSTWTLVDSVPDTKVPVTESEKEANGQVSLTVKEPPEERKEAVVSLTVK
ncbi:MAG: hypothetical protein ACLFP2_03705 [Candidatus Woesearchaeota archaeon]